MLVICPHCNKKHTIDEKKIPANATKARCTTCGNSFALNIPKPAAEKKLDAPQKGDGCTDLEDSLSGCRSIPPVIDAALLPSREAGLRDADWGRRQCLSARFDSALSCG